MDQRYVLAIDQGTTATTLLMLEFSKNNSVRTLAKASAEFPQYYPQEGWVEHDLDEVWDSVGRAWSLLQKKLSALKPGFSSKKIEGIGITNQRETLCIFDSTGRPIHRAAVWQCKRGEALCEEKKNIEPWIRKRTGLVCDPYFSGSKILWFAKNNGLAAALKNRRARLGTIDTYLMAKLSSGSIYATEPSNASRTLLYNLHSGTWDEELLDVWGIAGCQNFLPEIKDSVGVFGRTQNCGIFPDGIPIFAVLGDQQAALVGQGCTDVGSFKCTYGTGAFLLQNTGHEIKESTHGLLTTVAYSIRGQRTYALEGSIFIAGAGVQFIRDQLGFLGTSQESEQLAKDVQASPYIYFVPALAGLGAPYWNSHARGAFFGLTRSTDKKQLVRAVLESMAFSVYDLLEAFKKDTGLSFPILRVDGGASSNRLLLELQADIANLQVERPKEIDTTGFGVGLLAGQGLGIVKDIHEFQKEVDCLVAPSSDLQRQAKLGGWRRAIRACEVFAGS